MYLAFCSFFCILHLRPCFLFLSSALHLCSHYWAPSCVFKSKNMFCVIIPLCLSLLSKEIGQIVKLKHFTSRQMKKMVHRRSFWMTYMKFTGILAVMCECIFMVIRQNYVCMYEQHILYGVFTVWCILQLRK